MKKVGVGLVRAGWMGALQLRRLAERDAVEIRTLFEPDRDRALATLGELSLPASLLVNDHARIVADDRIDAVWLGGTAFGGDVA